MKIFFDSGKKHVMIQRMEPVWNEMGHFLSDSPKGCDVQLSMIRIEQHSALPIVVRLDGVYYDLATTYMDRNIRISASHSMADGIVYQSAYGKGLCEYYLEPKKPKAVSRVIFNGIKKSKVKRRKHKGMNIVVASVWRRHKRLKEIIEVFLLFASARRDVYLYILGDLCDNVVVKDPRIFYYGTVKYSKMKDIYEIADLHIHLSKRDNCPNTVIEAIGAGIPVLTTNLCGGAAEVCDTYVDGKVVVEGENSFFPVYNYEEAWNVLPRRTRAAMLEAMYNIQYTKTGFGVLPDILDIRNVAREYIEIMEEVCGKK